VYLDNLRAHHSVVVRECAEKNNQELVFSGSYASELNPIEIAWAWAKRSFQTKMATHADMRDTEAIIAKVNESIEELKACSIKKHVEKCFERISVYLEHIEADPGFTIS
jgi:transposase